MPHFIRLTACMAFALAITTSPVLAATGADNANTSTPPQALIQKYQKKSQKLQQIHQKALQNNPSLKKEQENYRDMVQAAMKDQGYDMKASREKLKKIAQKLQKSDLPKSKKKELMQKFQMQRQQMTQARRSAMKEPKIQKARQELKQSTLAAMKEQNPKTDELIASMRKLQKKLRQSIQQSKGSN